MVITIMAVLDPNHYAGKQLTSALIHVSFFKLIMKNPDVANSGSLAAV